MLPTPLSLTDTCISSTHNWQHWGQFKVIMQHTGLLLSPIKFSFSDIKISYIQLLVPWVCCRISFTNSDVRKMGPIRSYREEHLICIWIFVSRIVLEHSICSSPLAMFLSLDKMQQNKIILAPHWSDPIPAWQLSFGNGQFYAFLMQIGLSLIWL